MFDGFKWREGSRLQLIKYWLAVTYTVMGDCAVVSLLLARGGVDDDK
jgi:hypothetical protein